MQFEYSREPTSRRSIENQQLDPWTQLHRFRKEQMCDFVGSRDGRVRFDTFGEEHSFGLPGFYSFALDLRQERNEVVTPCKYNADYRAAFTELLVELAGQAILRRGICDRPLEVVEIGGGNGALKREALPCLRDICARMGTTVRYRSVDANRQHLEAQTVEAHPSTWGFAQRTRLAEGSVDLLFDDEVMDCLPYRVFKYSPARQRLEQEGFVEIDVARELAFVWGPVEDDDFARDFEEFLRRSESQAPFHCVSNAEILYWKESQRILAPHGIRVTLDYNSFLDRKSFLEGKHQACALKSPYLVDLTYGINFRRQRELAVRAGLRVDVHSDLAELFDLPIPQMLSREALICTHAAHPLAVQLSNR